MIDAGLKLQPEAADIIAIPTRHWQPCKRNCGTSPGDGFLWYLQAAILSQKGPEHGSPEFDPRDQGSLNRLVQTLKKSGKNEEIPELLSGYRSCASRRRGISASRTDSNWWRVKADSAYDCFLVVRFLIRLRSDGIESLFTQSYSDRGREL
jgi:hypothetical protein